MHVTLEFPIMGRSSGFSINGENAGQARRFCPDDVVQNLWGLPNNAIRGQRRCWFRYTFLREEGKRRKRATQCVPS
jgi:hypothetical protein